MPQNHSPIQRTALLIKTTIKPKSDPCPVPGDTISWSYFRLHSRVRSRGPFQPTEFMPRRWRRPRLSFFLPARRNLRRKKVPSEVRNNFAHDWPWNGAPPGGKKTPPNFCSTGIRRGICRWAGLNYRQKSNYFRDPFFLPTSSFSLSVGRAWENNKDHFLYY